MSCKSLLSLFLLTSFVTSCASYTSMIKEVRDPYLAGNFESAYEKVEKSDLKKQKKNRLLYLLNKAQILDRLGKLKESRKAFMQADQLSDELYTKSISDSVASFVVNDSTTAYSGEDYEIIAIHISLAMSFLEDQNYSSALVEARKINSKISQLNNRYEKNKNKYQEDAFARYLAGIIHEKSRNYDDAIIDYKFAIKVYESASYNQFGVSTPNNLVRALHNLLLKRNRQSEAQTLENTYPYLTKNSSFSSNDEKEVIIVHEVGVTKEKVNKEQFIPWAGKIMRFSFPVIPAYTARSTYSQISVSTKNHISTDSKIRPELVQNLNNIASVTLEDRSTRVFLKSAARLVIKDQLTQKANKDLGPLAGLVLNIAGAITETGDTRSWSLMPSRYYISRFNVPKSTTHIYIFRDDKLKSIEKIGDESMIILRDK